MALKPAIGKKYARLREEQEALLAAAGQEETVQAEERLHVLAAAATANAWQVTRPTFLEDEARPHLQSEEWGQMESILQHAMELQQKHLESFRQRSFASSDRSGEEELCLQMSLENIRKSLQAAEAAVALASHQSMIQSVTPQVLQHLPTIEVFAFRTVNRAVWRACQDGELLSMPILDFVPEHRDDMPLFFTKLSLRSTLVVWMNSVGAFHVLETRFSLPALETFLLSPGIGILIEGLQVPSWPSLRQLFVCGGMDHDPEWNWLKAVHQQKGVGSDQLTLAGVHWIQELLQKSPRLQLLLVDELDPRLALVFMKAVCSGSTRPRRLIFQRCVLPDAAIEYFCNSLEVSDDEFVVRFSACELSVISEGLLLQVLEDFSFCAFSIQGGKVSEAPIMADEWAEEPRRPARVRRRDPMKGVEEPQLQDQALGSGVRPVDHMNQLSTAELLEHVMRRLTEERGSTQASAIQSFMESLASGAGPSFSIPMQPESAALGEDFDGMD